MYITFSILLVSIVTLGFDRSVVGQSTDPCNNPRSLGSASKRSILNDPGTCDGRLCDNAIQEEPGVWYTLDGETTGNRMPESCVPVWRCGTYIPIWMNGAHPTEGSPGPVNVSVCAQHKFNGDCCAWRDQIRVKYCSSTALGVYYVYQLKIPPYCDMAYCGGSGIVCPQNWAWNEIKNNCTTPRYPTLPDVPVLSSAYISDSKTVIDNNGNDFTAKRFSVNCTFKYRKQTTGDDGARFDVIFEAGQIAIARFTVTPSSAEEYVTVMDESYLTGHLDNYLRCKVASYWQSPYPARNSTPQVSNQIYYGLQTLDSSGNVISAISVSEAQRVAIQIQATFPITTPWCFNIPAGARCNPSYTLRIFSEKLLLSSCTFELSYTNSKSASITLSPIPTPGTVIQPYKWPLYYQTDSNIQTDGSIFRGYKSLAFNVNIIDAVPQKSCYFTGDPHVYTFGRRSYNIYLVGDFYLARVSSRELEIQVRTISCTTGGEISCTCGVMLREGNNIIGINNCGFQSPQLIRYLKDVSNPGGTILNSGYTWTIKSLSGVEIQVITWGSRYFHVYVYGLGNEEYEGLCSYSGSQTQCNSDCSSDNRYRVPDGESIFSYSSSNVPTCKSSPFLPSCDCLNGGSRSVPCYSPDQSNLLLMQYTCNTPKTRGKREAAQPGGETFYDIDLFTSNMTFDRNFGKNPVNLVWPTANGITERAATEQCTAAVRRSPAYTFCTADVNANISEIIRTCVLDIQISDELTFAESSLASQLELLCQFKIKVEAVETENSSDTEAKQQEETLMTMLCDQQCNQKGDCINGVCKCNSGFTGRTCSLKDGQMPRITGSVGSSPTCDIRSYGGNPCLQVVVVANASDTRMTCKIRDSTGYSYFDMSPSVNLPGNQVTCKLKPSPVSSSDTSVNATTDYTIFVSVSFDGNKFSNELQFIIYDGLCVLCKDGSCTPKSSSSCSIRGRCYRADQSYQCTKDLFMYCKPNLCSTRWMTKNSGSCKDGFDACPSSTSKLTSVGILWLMFAVSMTIIYKNL